MSSGKISLKDADMKLYLLNTDHGLFPCTDKDFDEKKKLKIGEVYQVEIKLARNYEFLKKYHKLIAVAWEYQDEKVQEHFHNSKESFRETVQIAAGYTETFYSIKRREWLEKSRSISFESMTEEEFSDLYSRVKDVLFMTFLRHITQEEFEKQLINF